MGENKEDRRDYERYVHHIGQKATTSNEAGVLLLLPCNAMEAAHASPFPDDRGRCWLRVKWQRRVAMSRLS